MRSTAVLQNQLVRACEAGDEKKAAALLEQGAEPNVANTAGKEPLAAAIFGMCPGIVNILLKKFKEKDIPLKTWGDYTRQNLIHYRKIFIVPKFDPNPIPWSFMRWRDLLNNMDNNLFVRNTHLDKANTQWGVSYSWQELKGYVTRGTKEFWWRWVGGAEGYGPKQVIWQNTERAYIEHRRNIQNSIQMAHSANNKAKIRKTIKDSQRERIISVGIDNIDKQDGRNQTELHQAASSSLLKNYARLILLGANRNIHNIDHKIPAEYLDNKQLEKISKLQSGTSKLLADLNTEPYKILASQIIVDGASISLNEREKILSQLYEIKEIRSILELAKLAAMGLHDQAENPKFSPGYDSDDDDDIELKENQRLLIRVDAREHTVEGVCHHTPDGKTAYGLYLHKKNTLYVGGSLKTGRTKDKVRGTLIHEMTHFVAMEVFKNACNPYSLEKDEKKFEKICSGLSRRKDSLDPILGEVFCEFYTRRKQHHSEAIVRVTQMIVEYNGLPNDGLKRLKAQAPELLQYYIEVFLGNVEKHIERLKQRALSNWPMELFQKCWPEEGYSFQRMTESKGIAEPISTPSTINKESPDEAAKLTGADTIRPGSSIVSYSGSVLVSQPHKSKHAIQADDGFQFSTSRMVPM